VAQPVPVVEASFIPVAWVCPARSLALCPVTPYVLSRVPNPVPGVLPRLFINIATYSAGVNKVSK